MIILDTKTDTVSFLEERKDGSKWMYSLPNAGHVIAELSKDGPEWLSRFKEDAKAHCAVTKTMVRGPKSVIELRGGPR